GDNDEDHGHGYDHQAQAACPKCQAPSRRVHSRYLRTVADLPWQGVAVHLELSVRRFFCRKASCPQRIFCERVPALVAPHARRPSTGELCLGWGSWGTAGQRASDGNESGYLTAPDSPRVTANSSYAASVRGR